MTTGKILVQVIVEFPCGCKCLRPLLSSLQRCEWMYNSCNDHTFSRLRHDFVLEAELQFKERRIDHGEESIYT